VGETELNHPAIIDCTSRPWGRIRGAALHIIAALFGIVGLLHAAKAAPLSREAFTQAFVTALEAARPGTEIRVLRSLSLQVVDEKGGVGIANLENAFVEYRLDPGDLESIVRRHVAAYTSALSSERRPIDRSRIVPVVKSRRWIADYAAIIKEQGYGDDAVAVHDLLNSELVVVYAEDRDKTYLFLRPGDLTQLGLDRDDLAQLARDNLAQLVPPPELITGPFAYGIRADGNYEASLLLYPSWWESRPIKVDGDYVVAVPARDILMITGSNNQAGIAQLRALARQTVEHGDHTIVDTLFVFRDGRFERFE
jgi:uncharacterized protein YtpQ (UPF0354 family)